MSGHDHFLVAVCQLGAEPALKREVTREHPQLRAAFARPGLVTFKSTAGPVGPDFVLRSVFARAFASALGPARAIEEVARLADGVRGQGRLRLHVWERDTHRPGEAPPLDAAAEGERAAPVRDALRAVGGERFLDGEATRPGDHVLDVIVAGEEPLFVGHHIHSAAHSPFAGGGIAVEVPPEAPSRAYRKLEEALRWSRVPVRRGQVAVEVGSSPGGASYALLRRGLTVFGVDPGAMDPLLLASPRFHHLAVSLARLDYAALPPRADWLLLDVNLAAPVALHAIRGVVAALRPSLRGLLFTLKLNDWELAAAVPDLLRRIGELGFPEVRATQLPSNRQEIFACGLRRGVAASNR